MKDVLEYSKTNKKIIVFETKEEADLLISFLEDDNEYYDDLGMWSCKNLKFYSCEDKDCISVSDDYHVYSLTSYCHEQDKCVMFKDIYSGNHTQNFKSELEMLNWCTKNKMCIRVTNNVELDIVKELINRNIPEKGKVRLSDMSPHSEVYIRICDFDYYEEEIGWGSGKNEYMKHGANGYVEFETLYGWLE